MKTVLLLAVGALLLPALAGCDFITGGDPYPDEARLELEGDADAQVKLVVSKEFLAARRETGELTVELLGSDSLVISPPFNQTFDIREEQQFFARATPADTTVPTSVRMRVLLDGDLKFDESRDLTEDILQFLFLFNRRILTDVEVL